MNKRQERFLAIWSGLGLGITTAIILITPPVPNELKLPLLYYCVGWEMMAFAVGIIVGDKDLR